MKIKRKTKKINRKTKKINRKTKKKTNKRINKRINKTRSKKDVIFSEKIIDVSFSEKENLGTKASKNVINYHYQRLNNISSFLYILSLKKHLKNITFFKKINDCILQINIKNKNIYPFYTNDKIYKNNLNKCIKNKARFIAISINSELPHGSSELENHANILLIDKLHKKLELFEPHGYKPKFSSYSESVKKYHTKFKIIKDYFKILLPDYLLINVVDYIKDKNSFQSKYDSNSGYCVTWSLLYAHYRLLNQNVPIPILIKYLYDLININLLLRYAKYIEDTLKDKI